MILEMFTKIQINQQIYIGFLVYVCIWCICVCACSMHVCEYIISKEKHSYQLKVTHK